MKFQYNMNLTGSTKCAPLPELIAKETTTARSSSTRVEAALVNTTLVAIARSRSLDSSKMEAKV